MFIQDMVRPYLYDGTKGNAYAFNQEYVRIYGPFSSRETASHTTLFCFKKAVL